MRYHKANVWHAQVALCDSDKIFREARQTKGLALAGREGRECYIARKGDGRFAQAVWYAYMHKADVHLSGIRVYVLLAHV